MTEERAPISVLVIDDDAAIRFSLSALLRMKGYHVVLAESGGAGFSQFLEHRPQIVISDMIMPGHEGLGAIRKIHEMSPETPIIAMSGSIQGGPESFLERAQEAGATLCLEKPFEAAELLQMLENLTEG